MDKLFGEHDTFYYKNWSIHKLQSQITMTPIHILRCRLSADHLVSPPAILDSGQTDHTTLHSSDDFGSRRYRTSIGFIDPSLYTSAHRVMSVSVGWQLRRCAVNNNTSKTTNDTQLLSTINKLHTVLTLTFSHLAQLQSIVRISWNNLSQSCSSMRCRRASAISSELIAVLNVLCYFSLV